MLVVVCYAGGGTWYLLVVVHRRVSERLKRKIKVGRVLEPCATLLYQPTSEDVTK